MRAACTGAWLLLDNLQLSLDMIPNLVKFLESMRVSELELKEEYMATAEGKVLEEKRGKKKRLVLEDNSSLKEKQAEK